MIHRFIKHGKRFVEKIHKKISVKIADLRDAGNYAINPAILKDEKCKIGVFTPFRRRYRRFSFIARMDRFGKRSATCRGFRCGCAEKRLPLRGSQSKRNVYRAAKTRGRFYSRLFRARCTHVFRQRNSSSLASNRVMGLQTTSGSHSRGRRPFCRCGRYSGCRCRRP